MKNFIMVIFLFPLLIYANGTQLIEKFFSPGGINDKKSVYTGEMLEHYMNKPTLGEALSEGIERKIRILESSKKRKIFAVLLSKDGQSQDWYIYLMNKQKKWKISAVRNLALPGLFFIALQEVQKKTNRTKEEELQYQNMLLTIKSDSKLKEFLRENITKLDDIAKLSKTNLAHANEKAKLIYMNFVSYDKKTGIIDVNIGGMLDNSVGYLFVPNGKIAPSMSEENYIYIEPVVGNWYVYKTT